MCCFNDAAVDFVRAFRLRGRDFPAMVRLADEIEREARRHGIEPYDLEFEEAFRLRSYGMCVRLLVAMDQLASWTAIQDMLARQEQFAVHAARSGFELPRHL